MHFHSAHLISIPHVVIKIDCHTSLSTWLTCNFIQHIWSMSSMLWLKLLHWYCPVHLFIALLRRHPVQYSRTPMLQYVASALATAFHRSRNFIHASPGFSSHLMFPCVSYIPYACHVHHYLLYAICLYHNYIYCCMDVQAYINHAAAQVRITYNWL